VFNETARPRPLATQTLKLRRDQIHAGVTALVAAGIKPSTIKSLADLVSPDAFRLILRQRYNATKGRENSYNRALAEALAQIAREWVKVDAGAFAELKKGSRRTSAQSWSGSRYRRRNTAGSSNCRRKHLKGSDKADRDPATAALANLTALAFPGTPNGLSEGPPRKTGLRHDVVLFRCLLQIEVKRTAMLRRGKWGLRSRARDVTAGFRAPVRAPLTQSSVQQCAHLGRKLVKREWLAQKVDAGIEDSAVHHMQNKLPMHLSRRCGARAGRRQCPTAAAACTADRRPAHRRGIKTPSGTRALYGRRNCPTA
jgi:hypothetical protein